MMSISMLSTKRRNLNIFTPEMSLLYTIIDFNEVDIRIYLPEKVIIH